MIKYKENLILSLIIFEIFCNINCKTINNFIKDEENDQIIEQILNDKTIISNINEAITELRKDFLIPTIRNLSSSNQLNEKPLYEEFNIENHVQSKGYPIESYDVTTKDNYILKLHRIPHGKSLISRLNSNKSVIFLQPGLLCTSACFLDIDKALGFLLADLGFDVWVGNVRGTTFSKRHTYLDVKDARFWKFSWHEMGIYDLPAMIDFALNKSNKKKLSYIGHSQGTTAFFVMTSELLEYNEKINVMVALAPIAYLNDTTNHVYKRLAKKEKILMRVLEKFKIYEVFPHSDKLSHYIEKHCNENVTIPSKCTMAILDPFEFDNIDVRMLGLIGMHYPGGGSTLQLSHYAQLINSGKFQQYDYGIWKNLVIYNQTKPLSYDLSKSTVAKYLIYGDADSLATLEEVLRLQNELSNVVDVIKVPLENFNHIDFLYAKIVSEVLYTQIFELIQKYT